MSGQRYCTLCDKESNGYEFCDECHEMLEEQEDESEAPNEN